MGVADTIRSKLSDALSPGNLVIEDESAQHAGHAGARPGGESHYRVTIVSTAFTGHSRIERHRLVYGILAEELAGPVHALALVTHTPEEEAGPKS